jgi:hypothetical protein
MLPGVKARRAHEQRKREAPPGNKFGRRSAQRNERNGRDARRNDARDRSNPFGARGARGGQHARRRVDQR